jgi:hypothetical protein
MVSAVLKAEAVPQPLNAARLREQDVGLKRDTEMRVVGGGGAIRELVPTVCTPSQSIWLYSDLRNKWLLGPHIQETEYRISDDWHTAG